MTVAQGIVLPVTRLLAAGALFLLVGIRYGEATWHLPPGPVLLGGWFALAFLGLAALGRLGLAVRSRLATCVRAAAASAVAAGAGALLCHVAGLDVSRVALAYEGALLLALLLLNDEAVAPALTAAGNAAVFALALSPSLSDGSLRALLPLRRAPRDVRFLATSRHDAKLVEHAAATPRSRALGGGLARIDDRRVLLVSGDGQLVVLTPGPAGLDARTLPVDFPLEAGAYAADNGAATPFFRVTSALLEPAASGARRLYVAHHDWDGVERCLALCLSETSIDFDRLPERLDWVPRYCTRPCIPAPSNQSGGRLAFLGDDEILMTIGVHGTPGSLFERAPPPPYGSIVAIRRSDGSVRTFTTGHRNPQGLWAEAGQVWSTEHGPQGGDELNLLEEGRDYGWPRATYGTAYGQKDWPPARGRERRAAGTKPVFAWVPSIAISNVIRLRGTAFPAWKDDLLVGSLGGLGHGDSIFRVVLDGQRVAFVERIHTRRPVRDLLELADGRLLLWNGDGTVQTVEPATHVFAPCSGCHALRWASHGVGPDLMGVVGRKVAFHERFAYSDALGRLGGRWTRSRLDAFLRNPAEFAPGTSMDFPGLPDAGTRATLLDYLEDVSREE